MPTRPLTPFTWAAVYADQHCIGHLIGRGRHGLEAFDADDKSLGMFPTASDAAKAIETSQLANGGDGVGFQFEGLYRVDTASPMRQAEEALSCDAPVTLA